MDGLANEPPYYYTRGEEEEILAKHERSRGR